ncbi:MAG: diacylglycerol kinase family protein [Phocaeicola sp.]|uniref:diacylglycerol kinase family protein n=1 Tax=Phocaeicola sp. TaxID=2773926 RepID=UPI0023CD4313|nr:diacylglycerol kinase family protein [Phocaeicola sp.]MDE5678310.1 diacylglycerol kinase family protein [Phocaeicola sp.]MDE6180813.1 diacylglycerol kinase family protein [Phocaeicola sp.]
MNELQKRIKSFAYAWKGVCSFLSKEHNAWIHCTAIVVVTAIGFCTGITHTEWLVLILCFAMVLAAEAFNTAIERLVDLASPDFHPLAGQAKDIAAGAVLICAIGAAIIGLIIFVPYFQVLIYHLFH